MAGIVLGILKIVQTIFCAGSKDHEDQQQHQQQQQGSYAQHAGNNQYPPQSQPGYPGAHHQQSHQQQPQHHRPQGQGQGAWGSAGPGQGHHANQQQSHASKPQYQYEGKHTGGMIGSQPHGQYQNQDQINATDAHYTALRNQARKIGDQAHSCFARSQAAFQRGDGQEAHELSVEGKRLMQEKDRVDDEAEEWIYRQNNLDSPPGTIDLHGLYVKEGTSRKTAQFGLLAEAERRRLAICFPHDVDTIAIERVDAALDQAKRNDEDELRIIVGKGIHSQGHVAKIKPAVEQMMVKYNLSAHVDPHNTGVLIVDLKGREGQGRSRDAGTVVDELGGKGQDCVIM